MIYTYVSLFTFYIHQTWTTSILKYHSQYVQSRVTSGDSLDGFSLLDGHPCRLTRGVFWVGSRPQNWVKSNFSMNYERQHQFIYVEKCSTWSHCVRGNIQYTYLISLNERSSFRDEFQYMRILVYIIYLLDLWIFWAKVVGDVDCLGGYLS